MDSPLAAPDPPLQTDLVRLRRFELSDAPAIVEACRSPDIAQYTFMPAKMNARVARAWIDAGHRSWAIGRARFAITLPPQDTAVGHVGVSFEWELRRASTFYWLDPSARGRGVATAALGLVTKWAFDVHAMWRVQLVTELDNEPSQGVARRCGYEREGILRAWQPFKGDQPDMIMWSAIRPRH